MEIVMVIVLAVMGVYFFKSTDLPKDLKERSAQFQSESINTTSQQAFKINLPKNLIKVPSQVPSIDNQIDAKLAELKIQKKVKEIQVLNEEIDKLTLIITSLEQEIKTNNERNSEIQSTIETHLIRLQLLQVQVTALS